MSGMDCKKPKCGCNNWVWIIIIIIIILIFIPGIFIVDKPESTV
ncbi:hypothetical protein [Thermoanaerobacterium sp. RBIITD]|nr:hypothetical protein [Thermoanaerobacterium sp. RBIITD]SNX54888.1 hypothetical protein SAMN05660242_2633 [Thermoanaerobacterium sp. RBIITD]